MAEIPRDLLDTLPEGSAAAFERLYPERPGPAELLSGLIARHLESVEEAQARAAPVDAALAQTIAERFTTLLASWDELPPDAHAAVHAAVHYYVVSDDAAGDLASTSGFEDDARVANACFVWIGRPELAIDLD